MKKNYIKGNILINNQQKMNFNQNVNIKKTYKSLYIKWKRLPENSLSMSHQKLTSVNGSE